MALLFSRWNWFKTAARAGIGLGCAFAILSFAADLWARQRLPYFESAFSAAMQRPVEIGGAGFDPIYGFYFTDFSVREKITAPEPLSIRRIEARTRFVLWPEPTLRVTKLVLFEPRIGVDVHPEDLFRSHLWLRRVPCLETRIGQLKFEAKLDGIEVRGGRIALFSPTGLRRDFEDVRFFAGKKWFSPRRVLFEGRAGDDPDARFKIDCRIRADRSGLTHSSVRAEFHHFTSAYLDPVLDGRYRLPEKNLTGSVRVSTGPRGIDVRGELALPEPFAPSLWKFWERRPRLRFELKGRRESDQVIFDPFTLRAGNVLLTGNAAVVWKKGRESYRAMLASKNIPAERLPAEWTGPWRFESGEVDCRARVKGDAKRFEPDAQLTLTDVNAFNRLSGVKIERATGSVRWMEGRIESRNLWMFWNHTPLRVSGFLSPERDGRLAIEGQTFPGQLQSLKELNPINASFRLTAKKSLGVWSGALRLDLERGIERRASNWVASFRSLGLRHVQRNLFRAEARRISIRTSRASEPAPTLLNLKRVRLAGEISPAEIRLRISDALFGNGSLRGKFSWDNARRIHGAFRLRGADAYAASRSLRFAQPARGKLDAALHVRGMPERPRFFGHYRIARGSIGPCPSLEKLSRQIGIEALHPILFERFFGRVRFENEALYLERWKLDGPDLRISADAKIREGAMTGRLTARFPMRVVHASSGLNWLAHFVGEREAVDFDFRIAGKPEQPRAHWLSGAFREKIQKRLAPWMRAELTRQIQKRLLEKAPAAPA